MKNLDDLYKAFEDRFRGSRKLVKKRLKIYRPLLAQVPRQAEGPTLAIDLGCGRGEWLEVLAEAGLEAVGVDTNARMAQEAIDNGLKIELQDALEHLGGRPDNSVAVISAFHMVEHVPTDYLIGLLDECNRVLIDDGLLILETPNPENISVGTHTFHLDPTHKSPLPPDLLEFLVGQGGFTETAILRLNGAPMIEAGPIERSIHLMFEVARDYACLARKRAAEGPKALAAFVKTASQQQPTDMGKIKQWLRSVDDEIVSISEEGKTTMSSTADHIRRLAMSVEAQSELISTGNVAVQGVVAALVKQFEDAKESAAEQKALIESAIATRDAEIARLHRHIADAAATYAEQSTLKEIGIAHRDAEVVRLNKSLSVLTEEVQVLVAQSSLLEARIHAFQSSTLRRLTSPLRSIKTRATWLAEGTSASLKFKPGSRLWRMTRQGTISLARSILARPFLAQRARYLLRHFPRIEVHVRAILTPNRASVPAATMSDFSMSTQHSNHIYLKLKAAVARTQRSAY